MSVTTRNAAEARLRERLSRALNVRAEALRSEIYGVLEESRIGRGVHHPGLPNPSSAPGDPPARQSGRLQESVRVLSRSKPQSLLARVGTTVDYAEHLEFGTLRVAPRPFARPALERFKRKVRGAF